jgi:hypothetical protein
MLRLACTADMLSEEKKESEDRTSRVLDVEKGSAVGMMVVGRRGPRLCGNSEQESEGQGQLCSTHTTAAGIVTTDLKTKRERERERVQSPPTRRTRGAISAQRQSALDEDGQRVSERDHEIMSPAATSLHSCQETPPDSLIRIFLPGDCRITNIAASNCTPSTLPDCQLWRGLEGNNGPEKPRSLL